MLDLMSCLSLLGVSTASLPAVSGPLEGLSSVWFSGGAAVEEEPLPAVKPRKSRGGAEEEPGGSESWSSAEEPPGGRVAGLDQNNCGSPVPRTMEEPNAGSDPAHH